MIKIRSIMPWTIGLLATLACVTPSSPAVSAEYVMKFGTATINETQHQFMKDYKEALEKASGGRIEVQVYPASQLGPIPREIEGVQLGTIQGYIGPVDFYVGLEPRYGVFSAPMLFRDEAHVAATIHDPEMQKIILDLAKPKRMVGIATLSIGIVEYATKNPLMRLADFNGKKIRINGTALERAKMSKLGATGIAMPLSEVMPALSQGTIDGTISGISVFVGFKMNDLVKSSRSPTTQCWCRLPSSARHGSIHCLPICKKSWSIPDKPSSPRCRPGRWNSPKSWRTIG